MKAWQLRISINICILLMIFSHYNNSQKRSLEILLHFGAHIGDLTNYSHFEHEFFTYTFCIRNNFFIFNLEKTVVHLQRSLQFVYNLSSNLGKLLFYHSNIESYFFKFIFFFLIKYRTLNSFVNTKWKGGYLSNYRQCFLKYINILSNIPLRIRNKRYMRKKITSNRINSYVNTSFYHRYLFVKLMMIIFEKSNLKRDWESEFSKILLFWRSFVFVRSFKSVFQIPDCLISINPDNEWYVISEYSKTYKFPSIGVVDSSSCYVNCTYCIPSNDDSIPLSLFYISIFLNIWLLAYFSKTNL
jgi:ribosomal protein S2